jgi:hypothetical protein
MGEVRLEEGKAATSRAPDGKSAGSAAYDASCARISLYGSEKRQTVTSTTPYIRGMSANTLNGRNAI